MRKNKTLRQNRNNKRMRGGQNTDPNTSSILDSQSSSSNSTTNTDNSGSVEPWYKKITSGVTGWLGKKRDDAEITKIKAEQQAKNTVSKIQSGLSGFFSGLTGKSDQSEQQDQSAQQPTSGGGYRKTRKYNKKYNKTKKTKHRRCRKTHRNRK